MRLITRITGIYLLIAIPIFFIGGLVSFRILHKQVNRETDYELLKIVHQMMDYMRDDIPYQKLERDNIQIRPLMEGEMCRYRDRECNEWFGLDKFRFSDTVAVRRYPLKHGGYGGTVERQRKLTVIKEVDGKPYLFVVYTVVFEDHDVVEQVAQTVALLFLILTIALVAVSYIVSHKIFRPFHQTLDLASKFDLQHSTCSPKFPKSNIREFKQLNTTFSALLERAAQEYKSLKEFSENASHEMQTPLAVIKGKLELLMQSPRMAEEDLKLLGSAYAGAGKLSKLGNALTLLMKIENREFANIKSVALSGILEASLFDFQEIMDLKGISVENRISQDVYCECDPLLLDILITNLLRNAIRHNHEQGKVCVSLSPGVLKISNTGAEPDMSQEDLFTRFRKGGSTGESLGLGLAIVKKICEVSGFDIKYEYRDGWHFMKVEFPESSDNLRDR
ncbi:hypothetical protein FUAX_32100 [Fulvitalea axinellae]|uniref:histidine kinase n=1 Tax=Fulvitalea axinellae TaxID=1182444 RepID=A0AAU9D490_9BACT|nr:hypothetical protein FUAX_32100 [Fulvitalea axinellae]